MATGVLELSLGMVLGCATGLSPADDSVRAQDNLIAFARLTGVVQYFHPADGALDLDWERFMMESIPKVEGASSAPELAQVLEGLFRPFAPTVRVWVSEGDAAPPAVDRSEGATRRLAIHHIGLGPKIVRLGETPPERQNIYQSQVVAVAPDAEDPRIPGPDSAWVADLEGGVRAHVPLSVLADDAGTLPRSSDTTFARSTARPGWKLPVARREGRFVTVITLFNLMVHFYPYWDVVDTDWTAAFRRALVKTALDEDAPSFLRTLRSYLSEIRDGHGNLYPLESAYRYPLPLAVQLVEDELIVMHVQEGIEDIQRGDRILAIDGEPVEELLEQYREQICTATEGWVRHKVTWDFLHSEVEGEAILQIESADETRAVRVERLGSGARVDEPRPEMASEVAAGIRYFNLDRTPAEDLDAQLETLASAQGVIFDLRGYPGTAGYQLFSYLSDETLHSAWWNTPHYRYPEQKDVEFQRSHWTLVPKKPRLPKAIAFLTDGRAISYAESCMAIVEHYQLGEIVGATTAGTNGNINRQYLPGFYTVIWTGMKVTKHDDTQHHGVGVQPTVPVAPTRAGIAAGRDEVLERANEVLREKIKG